MLTDPPSRRDNAALLMCQPLGFFCSQSCPGNLILRTQDWAYASGHNDASVISGYHTPVEHNVLRILFRGGTPIIQVLACAFTAAQLLAALRNAERERRPLIVSQFATSVPQTSARPAEQRNQYVLIRAATVLFAHASLGGKIAGLGAEAIFRNQAVETVKSPSNTHHVALGAKIGSV